MVNLIESLNMFFKEGLLYKRFSDLINRFKSIKFNLKGDNELKLESVHDHSKIYIIEDDKLIVGTIDSYTPYLCDTAYAFEIMIEGIKHRESYGYFRVLHTDTSLIRLRLDPTMKKEIAYKIIHKLLSGNKKEVHVVCWYFDGKGSSVEGEYIPLDMSK